MSKKIKTIIWSGVALVVLIAVTIALVLTAPSQSGEGSSNVSVDAIALIRETYSDVESMHIKNQNDDYTIELVGEELWRIRDTMDLKQITYMYEQTLTYMSTFSAVEVIEEDCADLSRYGLDDPQITFESKYNNGNTYSFRIGLQTADKNYYYLTKEGDNTVDTVTATSVESLLYTRYSYLDTEIIESFDSDDSSAVPTINYVKITRPDLASPIVLDEAKDGELGETKVQQSYLVMREPQFSLIAETSTESVIYNNFGLAANGIVKANITDEDRKTYGFDNPTAQYEMTYDDNTTVVLTLGSGFNASAGFTEGEKVAADKIDTYFLIREDVDQIYTVAASDIGWLKVQTKDLISSSVIFPNIVDLNGFDVQVNGQTYQIAFDPGEDVSDSSDYTATLNGRDADMDAVRSYLQLVMLTSVQDISTVKPAGTPKLTITYHYRSSQTVVVKVYVAEDTTTTVTLNDQTAFVGRSGFVNKVARESQNLAAGKAVDTEW